MFSLLRHFAHTVVMWAVFLLAVCCLCMNCAATGNQFTAFHKLGHFDGSTNQPYTGATYRTRRECSIQCTGTNCRYFSIRKHDDGFHCVRSSVFNDDLPPGTWTVFKKQVPPEPLLRRIDGTTSFDLPWADYANGFGSTSGNYWIGLERLYQLTTSGCYGLGVNMTDWNGGQLWAYYGHFAVGPSTDNYRLDIADYNAASTAGDSLMSGKGHSGWAFTTRDRDNDGRGDNCAGSHTGGWWYNACFDSHPTGTYLLNGGPGETGINWLTATGLEWAYSFKEFYMNLIFTEC